MANYLVLLKYPGSIPFPADREKARAETQQLLLPHVMHNEFELMRIEPWSASQQPSAAYKTGERCVVLEIKMSLTEAQLQSPDKILGKIKARLQRGHFCNERITTAQDHGREYSIITLSELNRHQRYVVSFHYQGALETRNGSSDDDAIVKEIQMLMQCGEMALGDYMPARSEGIDKDCRGHEVDRSETIVEVNVMINEFNIDFQDSDSIYYYVLGELDSCGCKLAYSYECSGEHKTATHIGLNVYCSYQALEIDDYEDLLQQL
jgi:hypothetical protein